jgi:hypothetical protein
MSSIMSNSKVLSIKHILKINWYIIKCPTRDHTYLTFTDKSQMSHEVYRGLLSKRTLDNRSTAG